MELKEGDIVLCKVNRIEQTTVFVDIEGDGEGSMIFSEVSAGRIRNIRDFVVPNKLIVCKVLRIRSGQVELSLRRVTAGERDHVMDRYKKEKVLANMIKPVLGDKTDDVLVKIKKDYDAADFLEEARNKPELIAEYVSKSDAEALKKVFAEKKEKEKEVRKVIVVKSMSSSGLSDIKSFLESDKADIYYLGSSKFSVGVKASDFKKANHSLSEFIEELKKKAKVANVIFEVKEK